MRTIVQLRESKGVPGLFYAEVHNQFGDNLLGLDESGLSKKEALDALADSLRGLANQAEQMTRHLTD